MDSPIAGSEPNPSVMVRRWISIPAASVTRSDLEAGRLRGGDRPSVDGERRHAGRRGRIGCGRQSGVDQGRDEWIVDPVAQADDERVTPAAGQCDGGEDVGASGVVAFDQDLVEPIERQAGQDRDDAADTSHLGAPRAADHAGQVRDPVLVLEGGQFLVRHVLTLK